MSTRAHRPSGCGSPAGSEVRVQALVARGRHAVDEKRSSASTLPSGASVTSQVTYGSPFCKPLGAKLTNTCAPLSTVPSHASIKSEGLPPARPIASSAVASRWASMVISVQAWHARRRLSAQAWTRTSGLSCVAQCGLGRSAGPVAVRARSQRGSQCGLGRSGLTTVIPCHSVMRKMCRKNRTERRSCSCAADSGEGERATF